MGRGMGTKRSLDASVDDSVVVDEAVAGTFVCVISITLSYIAIICYLF